MPLERQALQEDVESWVMQVKWVGQQSDRARHIWVIPGLFASASAVSIASLLIAGGALGAGGGGGGRVTVAAVSVGPALVVRGAATWLTGWNGRALAEVGVGGGLGPRIAARAPSTAPARMARLVVLRDPSMVGPSWHARALRNVVTLGPA